MTTAAAPVPSAAPAADAGDAVPAHSLAVRFRTFLLWLAAARAVLGIVAIPLAPFLYREHFAVLVLLRPTKEVLLAAGFLIRQGDVNPVIVVLAALPLMLGGVWQFFALGRGFSDELRSGEGLPKLAQRLLPPERVKKLCGVLDRKGTRLIFLGRLATFPSSLLGTAAGTAGMKTRRFLPADALGAFVGMAEVLIAGYLLGQAYKSAGPWLTGVGVVALLGMLFVLGRSLTRDRSN
jgi:membrane protein DedA with SNARE-associated domain